MYILFPDMVNLNKSINKHIISYIAHFNVISATFYNDCLTIAIVVEGLPMFVGVST